MRKIVAIENVTLDDFADSQEGRGFEWTVRAYDDEVDRYSNEHVRADVDTAMYGRTKYLGMQGFWSKMLDSRHLPAQAFVLGGELVTEDAEQPLPAGVDPEAAIEDDLLRMVFTACHPVLLRGATSLPASGVTRRQRHRSSRRRS